MDFQHWNFAVALLLNLFKDGYLCTAVASGVDAVSVCEQRKQSVYISIGLLNIAHPAMWLLRMRTSRYRCWNYISCSPSIYTYVFVCMCVCIYIYIYIYIYTHTHTHKHLVYKHVLYAFMHFHTNQLHILTWKLLLQTTIVSLELYFSKVTQLCLLWTCCLTFISLSTWYPAHLSYFWGQRSPQICQWFMSFSCDPTSCPDHIFVIGTITMA